VGTTPGRLDQDFDRFKFLIDSKLRDLGQFRARKMAVDSTRGAARASTSAVIFDGKSITDGACYHILESEKGRRDRMRSLLTD
jgi:hypothetical protein